MEQAKTHLGTKQLHKQHSVMIEGGMVPRARVMDQTMIDKYLMQGRINLAQHQAGEYLLRQAATARLWPTGVNLSDTRTSGGRRNFVPFGVFPYGRTLVKIKKRYGWFHAYLVGEVVVHDWDVSGDTYKMQCLLEGLDWISQRGIWNSDPLGPLKKAVGKKKAGPAEASPESP
jgi:hypothetical protein